MHSGAVVEYTVTLKDFEKQPDAWKLNQEESLTQAKLVKEKATAYLKMDRLDLAIKMYEKSNLYLSNCSKWDVVDGILETSVYHENNDFFYRGRWIAEDQSGCILEYCLVQFEKQVLGECKKSCKLIRPNFHMHILKLSICS